MVGTGALARSLTRALTQHGLQCRSVLARSVEDAESLVAHDETHPGVIGLDPIPSSDVVFIAVSDDALASVAVRLAEAGMDEGQVFLHTSGVHGASALEPLADAGARTGSFHPLQTFTGDEGKERFKGITIGIEGHPDAVRVARRLADDLLASSVEVSTDRKALYHAAAVMAGNHAIAMLAAASELWERATSDSNGATEALGPLTRQSVLNALDKGPGNALTGPVARGDVGTLEQHLDALKQHADHLLPVYASVVTETIHLATRTGRLSSERAVEMLDAVARGMHIEQEGDA